jgi:hypothetical protein
MASRSLAKAIYLSLITFLVPFLALPISFSAQAVNELMPINAQQDAIVRATLTRFMYGEPERSTLEALGGISGFTIALTALDVATPFLEIKEAKITKRVVSVLSFASRFLDRYSRSQVQREYLSTEEREKLHAAISPFLIRFRYSSPQQKTVLAFYEIYDLWDISDFWFLSAQMSDSNGVRHFAKPLLKIFPLLNAEQRSQAVEKLYSSKPFRLEQMTLLDKIGMLKPKFYRTMFKLLDEELVPHADYNGFEFLHAFQADYQRDKQSLALITLVDLQKRFLQNDPAIVDAFHIAKSRPQSELSGKFYAYFAGGSFLDLQTVADKEGHLSDPRFVADPLSLRNDPASSNYLALLAPQNDCVIDLSPDKTIKK